MRLAGEKALDSLPCSLQTLRSHSIFSTPWEQSTKSEDDWELVPRPTEDDLVPTKKQRLVTRDKDVILARGRELRMMSCSGEAWDMRLGKVGKYAVSIIRCFIHKRSLTC